MKRGLLLFCLLLFLPLISANYDGGFNLDKAFVQLGDEFSVTGNNINVGGEEYNGNAMLVFKGDNESYTLLTNVIDGSFSYTISFCGLIDCIIGKTKGEFDVKVTLLDLQLANLHEFDTGLVLNLVDTLDVTLGLENSELVPGANFELQGSVFRSIDSSPVNNINVKILVEDVENELFIQNNEFDYETILSNKIASNYHNATVTVEDEFGNVGVGSVRFYITPIPQWMEIQMNKTEFMPAEIVNIIVNVYDQANLEISKEIEFELRDPNGKKIAEDTLSTGQIFTYELEEYAKPGEWIINSESENLEADFFFNVKEVELLDISLLDGILTVKNVGNLFYDKSLVITAQKGENKKTESRRTELNPGEEFTLELFSMFSSGDHTFFISNTNEEFSYQIMDPRSFFKKAKDFVVGFTGQAIRSSGSGTSNIPTMVMIFLFVGGLIVFSIRLKMSKRDDVTIKKRRFSKLSSKKFKISNFMKKKDNVQELKEKILKDIESTHPAEKREESKGNDYLLPPSLFEKDFNKNKGEESNRVKFDEPFKNNEENK